MAAFLGLTKDGASPNTMAFGSCLHHVYIMFTNKKMLIYGHHCHLSNFCSKSQQIQPSKLESLGFRARRKGRCASCPSSGSRSSCRDSWCSWVPDASTCFNPIPLKKYVTRGNQKLRWKQQKTTTLTSGVANFQHYTPTLAGDFVRLTLKKLEPVWNHQIWVPKDSSACGLSCTKSFLTCADGNFHVGEANLVVWFHPI